MIVVVSLQRGVEDYNCQEKFISRRRLYLGRKFCVHLVENGFSIEVASSLIVQLKVTISSIATAHWQVIMTSEVGLDSPRLRYARIAYFSTQNFAQLYDTSKQDASSESIDSYPVNR